MKKILAVLLCVLVVLPCCLPFAAAKGEKETEIEFTLDPNERYTDIIEVSDGDILNAVAKSEEDKNSDAKRTVYIAVLVAAFVVSVVVLVVTLKRVPDEKDIDISGTNQKKKDNKTENNEE